MHPLVTRQLYARVKKKKENQYTGALCVLVEFNKIVDWLLTVRN